MSFPVIIALSPGEELHQDATKKYQYGQKAETIDGREFRYTKAGEALDVGIPCQSPGAIGDMEADTVAKLVTSITTYAVTASYLRISTTWGSPGGSTGVTKNVFRDGYVWLWTGTGAGQMLHIKENTTGSSDTGGYTDVHFRDGERLHEAIDTHVTLALSRNPYDSVIEYDGLDTLTGRIVGVPPRDVAVATPYFWLQTKGPCAVLTNGTVVIGNAVYPTTDTGIQAVYATPYTASTDTDALQRATDNTSQLSTIIKGIRRPTLGIVLVVGNDTEYSLVDIDL